MMAATGRRWAAACCAEAWAEAALGTARQIWCRGRMPRTMRTRSTAAPRIEAAAAMTLEEAERPRTRWRSIGACFIGEIADQLGVMDVTDLEGMSGGEGATGKFPDASTLLCEAVNMGGTVIGTGGIASAKGLQNMERAHCGLLRLARCQDLMPRLLTAFIAVTVPCGRMRLALRRVTVWDCARTRIAGRGSGRLEMRLRAAVAANEDVYGASRRSRPLVANLRLPLARSWRRVTRRGLGVPAAIVIRCTRG